MDVQQSVQELVLDSYQADLVDLLWSSLIHGDFGFLTAATGSGKSLICRALAHRMRKRKGKGQLKGVLALVPQNQIKGGWLGARTVCMPQRPVNELAASKKEVFHIAADDWHRGAVKQDSRRLQLTRWLKNPSPYGFAASHIGFGSWCKKHKKFLPKKLAGMLLIIDEAHHVAKDNQLGAAVKLWRKRGGKVLFVTATPFRTQGELPYPKDLIFAMRTLPQHIHSGLYAPQKIKIRTKQLSYTAKTDQQLSGDVMPEADRETLAEEIAALWHKDGKPKTVIIVPPKGSKHWARVLSGALAGVGARVHNAVGINCSTRSAIFKLLETERSVTAYKNSSVDIIIACKRFDEGTDWPLCSNVYNLGMPASFRLIQQRLGRTLRYKGGRKGSNRPAIKGYPKRWRNKSSLTFILPRHADKAWSAFETKHRDHAFLLACFINDANTGYAYLGELLHGMREHDRPRTGKKPQNKLLWEKAAATLHMKTDALKQRYMSLKRAAILLKKPNPTDEELGSWLAEHEGLYEEEIQEAFLARDLRQAWGNPKIMQALDARVSQSTLGVQSSDRIIQRALWKAWDVCSTDLQRDNKALVREARKELEVVSQFTGRSVHVVENAMRTALTTPYTVKEIEAAVLQYYKEHNTDPKSTSGDATAYFDFVCTWSNVDGNLKYNHNTTLRDVCVRLKLAAPFKIPLHVIRNAIKEFCKKTGKVPQDDRADDASLLFGFPVNWSQIMHQLRKHYATSPAQVARDLKLVVDPLPFTETAAVKAMEDFYRNVGEYPATNSKEDASPWFGFCVGSWERVNSALRVGTGGHPGGSSLPKLRVKYKLALPSPKLTLAEIKHAAESFWTVNKRAPRWRDDATDYIGYTTSWNALAQALSRGGYSLPKGKSLKAYLQEWKLLPPPTLPLNDISRALQAYYDVNGYGPSTLTKDGSSWFGEHANIFSWQYVNRHLSVEHNTTLSAHKKLLGIPKKRGQ